MHRQHAPSTPQPTNRSRIGKLKTSLSRMKFSDKRNREKKTGSLDESHIRTNLGKSESNKCKHINFHDSKLPHRVSYFSACPRNLSRFCTQFTLKTKI